MAEMYVYTDCRLALKTEPIYYNRNKYLDIQEFKPNDSDDLLGFRPVPTIIIWDLKLYGAIQISPGFETHNVYQWNILIVSIILELHEFLSC